MARPKLLPVGIPTFRNTITGGYLYVDKTPLTYESDHDKRTTATNK